MILLDAFAKTDIGKARSVNQDMVFCSVSPMGSLPNVFIVADGMGGHNGGEIASKTAIVHFCEYLQENNQTPKDEALDLLTSAARFASSTVLSFAKVTPELSGMGTTLTACTVIDSKCNIIHIGDSRAYAITKESITQLTNDHSYVNEMVKAGQITQTEAKEHPKRNILTKVLGINEEMCADGYVFDIQPDSVILLCSDGLYNMVSEDEIKNLVNTNTPQEAVDALVETANNNGGADNISVIVIECKEVIP